MSTSFPLSKAFDAFLRDRTASGYSSHTVRNYRTTFAKVQLFLNEDDPPVSECTRDRWVDFFVWLQEEYVSEPDGIAPRGRIQLSPKTLCNIHTDLSAFYTWLHKRRYVEEHVMRDIERPRYELPVVTALTQDEVVQLIHACRLTKPWKNGTTQLQRATATRDKAIILTLLSTGVRASELCDVTLNDVNLATHAVKVAGKGKGRDSKERIVYLGRRATRAVSRYLDERGGTQRGTTPLFCVGVAPDLRGFSRDVLGRLLRRIGDRAGVESVYPHRFRHTFAIEYLRNGGDVLTLQQLLGHTSLDMVRHYATLAAQDCANVHKAADPVDNWKL